MKQQKFNSKLHLPGFLFITIFITMALNGCASTENDPWQNWNHRAQSFNDSLDRNVLKPLAQGYQWMTPKFVDDSVSNAFSNMNDIGVTINDLLQFKLLQSGMDLSRLIVNSTVGMGGLLDAGQMMGLPKHNEDFGQTLAVWGVPSGPYLVIPFYGPSSPRETLGLVGDAFLNPLTYISMFSTTDAAASTAGAKFVEIVDNRAQLLSTGKIVDEATNSDRYEFIKNAYQQRREYLITDGKSQKNDTDLDNELDAIEIDEAKPTNPEVTKPKP